MNNSGDNGHSMNPTNDYNRPFDYAAKITGTALLGGLGGGVVNKLRGKKFLHVPGIAAGALLGGLGGAAWAHHKDRFTNRFANVDLPNGMYVVEMPFMYGLPGVHHTYIFAKLDQTAFDTLSEPQKKTWRVCSPKDGELVYYRVVSSNASGTHGRTVDPASLESDQSLVKHLFYGATGEDPASRTVNVGYYAGDGRMVQRNGLRGFIQGAGYPTHVQELPLKHVEGLSDTGVINKAMDYAHWHIRNNYPHYDLMNNNCHLGAVGSVMNNPCIQPVEFGTGGWRGAHGSTGDAAPETRIYSPWVFRKKD